MGHAEAHDHGHPHWLAPLRLLDQPQGHRHDVPHLRDRRGGDRCRAVGLHAPRAAGTRHPDLPRPCLDGLRLGRTGRPRRGQAHVQCVHHRSRPDHDLLHGHAGHDRRLRQLVRAADDRGAGHGVPAHEQHLVLAAAPGVSPSCPVDVLRRRPRARSARVPVGRFIRRSPPRVTPARQWILPSCRSTSPAPARSSVR